jgi:hypothetical protein
MTDRVGLGQRPGEHAILVRADSSLFLVDTHPVVTEQHLVLGPMSLSPVSVSDEGDRDRAAYPLAPRVLEDG